MRRTAAFGMLLLLLAGFLSGCRDNTKVVLTTGLKKDEVFRIADASCTLPEVMVYLTNLQNRYEAVYGSQIWKTKNGGKTLEEEVREQVLGELAQVKAMALLAKERQTVLDEREEERVAAAAREYFSSLNEAERTAMNVDEELILKMYREYALAQKVYRQIADSVKPEISDDEARTITVQMIRLTQREKAQDVLKAALEENADFEALARENSEDATITRSFGKGEMDAAVEQAAFDLGRDEISGVVAAEDGYYILKCISTFDEAQTQVNKERIAEKIRREAFDQEYDVFADSLVRQLNEELWKTVEMIHDENVKTSDFFSVYEMYMETQERTE